MCLFVYLPDNLLKELRASAVLKLSGIRPRIFLTPLAPSVRESRKYICANELSASQVQSLEWEEGKQLCFSGRAIKLLPFLLIDLPFESCICCQELKKQSMRGESMEKKKYRVEYIIGRENGRIKVKEEKGKKERNLDC